MYKLLDPPVYDLYTCKKCWQLWMTHNSICDSVKSSKMLTNELIIAFSIRRESNAHLYSVVKNVWEIRYIFAIPLTCKLAD